MNCCISSKPKLNSYSSNFFNIPFNHPVKYLIKGKLKFCFQDKGGEKDSDTPLKYNCRTWNLQPTCPVAVDLFVRNSTAKSFAIKLTINNTQGKLGNYLGFGQWKIKHTNLCYFKIVIYLMGFFFPLLLHCWGTLIFHLSSLQLHYRSVTVSSSFPQEINNF